MPAALALSTLRQLDAKTIAVAASLVVTACVIVFLASALSCQQQPPVLEVGGEKQLQHQQSAEAAAAAATAAAAAAAAAAGATTSASAHFPDDFLERELIEAEKAYEVNFAGFNSHRSWWNTRRGRGNFVAEALIPYYPCAVEERLGTWGEGGKWVCMTHYPYKSGGSTPVVVSIGSRGERSFEEAIHARLGAVPHTYDPFLSPAVDARMRNLTFLMFHKAGLVGSQDSEGTKRVLRKKAKALSLKGLLEDLNTTHIDIFKIDCEGCEYGVAKDIRSMWSREDQPLGQIQMEIHCLLGKTRSHCAPLMENLIESGYRLFHAEPNGYSSECFELAWIHESYVKPRSLAP